MAAREVKMEKNCWRGRSRKRKKRGKETGKGEYEEGCNVKEDFGTFE